MKESLPAIERFTVLLYHRSSNCVTANDCRRDLFCQGRSIDNIPPSSSALWKHLLRSSYVAGYIWGQSMISHQALPDVEEWGWKLVDGKLVPHWSDLPEATLAIRDLIKCMCKSDKGCRERRKM